METSQCCPLISLLELRSFGEYEFSLCSSLISNLRHNFFFHADPRVNCQSSSPSSILPPGTKYEVNLSRKGPQILTGPWSSDVVACTTAPATAFHRKEIQRFLALKHNSQCWEIPVVLSPEDSHEAPFQYFATPAGYV